MDTCYEKVQQAGYCSDASDLLATGITLVGEKHVLMFLYP
jgi:hypothetical protein